MDEITHGIWIGDIQDVREKSTERFDRVITVCQDDVEDNVGCEYEHFNMSDGPNNEYGGDSSYKLFREAAACASVSIINEEEILIHCHAGQSRSPAVAIAALGATRGQTYDNMYEVVRANRPQIHPNNQLVDYAKRFIEKHTGVTHRPFQD